MTKIIACGLIIAVGWFCGGIYADYRQKSYLELCGMISLLESMKNAISYSRTELYGIFVSFSDKALDSCGFTETLKSSDIVPANEIWHNALERLSVGEGIKDVLSSFGSTLGLLDCDTQIERIEGCMAFLSKEREQMRAALAGKIKSYRYLGALAGCLAAIVLY
ncbi:MAG: stage III sporulation protein AB [Eubacteriales bacterium]|nr:stage III sporulation protein AB [Eubacteriales bacterium]